MVTRPLIANQESSSGAVESTSDNARNIGLEMGPNFFDRRRGNMLAARANNLQKPEACRITTGEWHRASAAAFQDHVGSDAHAPKRLSRILDCSPRTAENLLKGRTSPSGVHFLRAYAMVPEFASEVRRLTGMEQSIDPEFERDLSNFLLRASAHLEKTRGE